MTILPQFLEMTGVWLSITAREVLSIIMSIYYFRKFRGCGRIKEFTCISRMLIVKNSVN